MVFILRLMAFVVHRKSQESLRPSTLERAMRREGTAALIAILVVASLGIGYLSGSSARRTETITSTSTSVSTSILTSQRTVTSTTTYTSTETEAYAPGAAVTTAVGSNGLRLSASINATQLTIGQELNISVSLFNTLQTNNRVIAQNTWIPSYAVEGNWTFYGIPVSIFTDCYPTSEGGSSGIFWPSPIEVVVLSGNYTAQQLPSTANATSPITCREGGVLPYFTFEPDSSVIDMTIFASASGGGSVGLFPAVSSFTIGGYWNVTSLSQSNPAICVPAVPVASGESGDWCAPPPSMPFTPGVYTVGVSDEWEQSVMFHFTVNSQG